MMDVDAVPSGLNEDRLIFYSSPGTLTSLACSKMALFCWSYEIRGLYPDEASSLQKAWFIKHKFSCVDVYKTPLPSSIVEKTDNYIEITGVELAKWMNEFDIFIDNTHDVMLRCIDHIIIEKNGIISYTKTARSLLDTDEMNSYEKCTIAYTYCFESDMKRLLPSLLDDPSQRLPSCDGRKIPIYCWDRLDSYLKSTIINALEYTSKKSHEIKFLLPKLSPDELSFVFRHTSTLSKTFRNLADNEVNCHYAIQFWNFLLFNGKITRAEFFDIVKDLCQIYNDDDEKKHLAYSTHSARRILLQHIWFSAPYDWKISIYNRRVYGFFCITFDVDSSRLIEAYGLNMDIFLDLLTNSELQLRETLWRDFWRKFIVFAAVSDLEKIIELCVPHDIAKFKKRMLNCDTLKREFELLIANGRCLELENYLKLICSSEVEEKLVKMQIIVDSCMNKIFKLDFETLKRFTSFIDNAFSSAFLANQRKDEWFRGNLDKMYTLVDQGLVENINNIANLLLGHNLEYLTEIKKKFLIRCRDTLISGSVGNFSIRHWQEFIEWCTSTNDEFIKFKSRLPLDEIFESFLLKIIERGRNAGQSFYPSFTPLSNFLRWYFNDEEAVKKFMSEKLVNYQQVHAIRNLVEEGESWVVHETLKWFFDGDKKQAKNFHQRALLRKKFIDDRIWKFS